jgi:hypothetical protein
MQRCLSLGTDYVEMEKIADESKGISPCFHCSHIIFMYWFLFV